MISTYFSRITDTYNKIKLKGTMSTDLNVSTDFKNCDVLCTISFFAGPGFALCSLHNMFCGRPFYRPSGHSPAVDCSNSSRVASHE